jgi:hypothetical protein
MRPTLLLGILLFSLAIIDTSLYLHNRHAGASHRSSNELLTITTAGLGLTDLCVATEARYTRHPAISDPGAPRMDHPGAIEHFPTGSFWAPPEPQFQTGRN